VADAQPRHRAYNLWVAVRWYGLVVCDFWGAGVVNGTICCTYFKSNFRPKSLILGSLGVIVGTLELDCGGFGLPRGLQTAPLEPKKDLGMDFGRFCALHLGTRFGTPPDKNLSKQLEALKKSTLKKRNEEVMKWEAPEAQTVVFYLALLK